jgi:hypothetical protein
MASSSGKLLGSMELAMSKKHWDDEKPDKLESNQQEGDR